MNALAKFDEELKKANSYEILGIKVLKWIFTFIGMGLMITVPVTDEKMVPLMTWSFLWVCVMWHIREKCYFMQDGKRISVYKIIGRTPINRRMYIENRCKYLFPYLIKFAVAAEVMQIIGLLLEGRFDVQGILKTLVILVIYFVGYIVFGVLDIYMSTR